METQATTADTTPARDAMEVYRKIAGALNDAGHHQWPITVKLVREIAKALDNQPSREAPACMCGHPETSHVPCTVITGFWGCVECISSPSRCESFCPMMEGPHGR